MNQSYQYSDPASAIKALAEKIVCVSQTEPAGQPVGRILAQTVVADRDSPAADVSAMDGYAIRLADLRPDSDLLVSGESKAGAAPPALVPGRAVRIFTGAIIPEACEAVIKREDTRESDNSIQLSEEAIRSTVAGMHIRRRGENAPAGTDVLAPGTAITAAVVAALANFGCVAPIVSRPVKVAVLTTGDEVVDPATKNLDAWQLRNSNCSAIVSMLGECPFAKVEMVEHVPDDPASLVRSLTAAIESSDAIVMTGGVSKGDYDYVPDTIAELGGQIVFHGLPIRPGKPILGATTDAGKLILGLPGNPVSTTINCHRFLLPLLSRIAGKLDWTDRPSTVTLRHPPMKSLPLHTMLLIRLAEDGLADLVPAKGSGDLVALAHSDGYVSVPPMTTTPGPWPLFRW